MDSNQLTKISAAIVMSLLALIVIGKFSGFLYAPQTPEKPGFEVAVEEEGHGVVKEAAPKVDLAALMASADVDKGKAVAKKCAACHSFEEGGKNGAGANLFEILGREIANKEGFKYSKAFMAKKEEGFTWGYEELFEFTRKPKAFIKGTAMGFGGIKRDSQRADLIVYLRSLSASPLALPVVAAAVVETTEAVETTESTE